MSLTRRTALHRFCEPSNPKNLHGKLRAILYFSLLTLALLPCKQTVFGELKPQTRLAFEKYVRISEQRISSEEASDSVPLLIDELSHQGDLTAKARVRRGDVIVESRVTRENGQPMTVPDGMVHHWVGIVFVPGLTIRQTVELMQDYNNHDRIYAPDVERSR